MDNFIFSLNATVPIFLLIVVGWFLMRLGILSKAFTASADKYVFKVALPAVLFKDIATADIRSDFDPKFFFFCMIATSMMFLGVWFFANLLIKDKSIIGRLCPGKCPGKRSCFGHRFCQ